MVTEFQVELLAEQIAAIVAERLQQPKTKYLSRKEKAKAEGISVRSLDRAISEGRLTVNRACGKIRIAEDAEIQSRGEDLL